MSVPIDVRAEHEVILRRVDRLVRITRSKLGRSRAALEESLKVLEGPTVEAQTHPALLRGLCERRMSR